MCNNGRGIVAQAPTYTRVKHSATTRTGERRRNREDKVTDDYVSKRDITFRVGERGIAADMIATRTRAIGCDPVIFAAPADKRACCKLLYRDCTFSGSFPLRSARPSTNALGEMHYSEDAIRLNCVPTNR